MNSAFITLLFFLFPALTFAGQTLVWGIDEELSPIIKIASELQDAVEKRTEGRVKIVVKKYNSKTLKNEFLAIQKGTFHIHQQEVDKYYKEHPALKYWDIPFLFLDRDHVESYIESPRAQELLSSVEDKYRQHVSYSYAGGFLFVFSQKKINSMADLSGMTCESDGGGDLFFQHFLKPRGIAKTKDGARGDKCAEILSSDLSMIYSELEKGNYSHITLTRHRLLSRILSVSKKSLSKMLPKDRDVLVEELKKFSKHERDTVYDGIQDIKKILAIRGLSYEEWSLEKQIQEKNQFLELTKKYRSSLNTQSNEEINYIEELSPNSKSELLTKN